MEKIRSGWRWTGRCAGGRALLPLTLLLLAGWLPIGRFAAGAPLYAQTAPPSAPAARAPMGREAAGTAGVLRATLDNGLQVAIVRNPLAPVVTTVMTYRVGSNEAPEGFPGTAHALEHMMFRGSPGLGADQLAAVSAGLGGDNNADTAETVTRYYFTVPAEDLEVALHIEAVRMSGILATDELWAKERGAIEQEVARDLSNPQYVLFSRLRERLFQGTVYAHDALGTRPSFERTSAAMLRQFHQTWYVPNNALLTIVGDVDPKDAMGRVRRLLGGLPSRPLPPRPVVRFQPVRADTIHLDTDLPYGLALVVFRLPGTDSPDYAATRILADVLSSRRGSLYALVPEGRALYAGFQLSAMPAASLGFAAAAFPQGGDGEELTRTLQRLLETEIRQGVSARGVSADLVEAARRREIADREFQKDSVAGLARVWSEALAVRGLSSPDEELVAIRRVTLEDVRRVAREQLDPAKAIVAVLTPRASGEPVSGGGFGGQESFAPSEMKPVALPGWAEAALRRLPLPQSTVNPLVSTLPNGLQLIMVPETVSRTASLYGHIDSNPYLQAPPGKEGVEDVLDQLFSYGTTTLDREAYEKALDEIAADVSAGTGFSLQVLAEHFERGVELLADQELRPALPEAAFATVQKQQARATAGQLQSPDYRAERAFYTSLLPPGDPALRETTPQSLSALTLADVRAYYRQVFRPDMTTVVVIGAVAPEEARRVVEKYLGGWTATGPKPPTRLPSVPPNRPAAVQVPDASKVQDEVTLGQTLRLTRSQPDYYPLELGNHVLGGAFYATRLYRDLREAEGLVYSVESSLEVGRSRGFYSISYACDPQNVLRVRAIALRNLRQMLAAPVSDAELRQAKALLLREIPLSEASLDGIAGGLLDRVQKELPLDEPLQAAHRYLQLTARDVQEAFGRWIRPDDLVQITVGPPPR